MMAPDPAFAEAARIARASGDYRHEGCGYASFAADLTAHRRRVDTVGTGLADIRARLARIAEAEGWEMPGVQADG